jgi:thiosulfate dehydrogenase (quinone) large subunit
MGTLRNIIYVAAAVAAISLAWLVVPDLLPDGDLRTTLEPTDGLRAVLTWIFWISFIVLIIALFRYRNVAGSEEVEVEGPGFARFLFNNSAAGLFWLPIRIFLGVSWLETGLHKLGDPAWTGGGTALRDFWERAVVIPEPPARPAISYEWYRDFLNQLLNANAESWFAWVITLGEIAVGLGLIVGALTGIAAFFGAFMNMSFLLAGAASTNPVLFTMAVGVMLAWKVAGYYGLDRYLLPALGTPWRRGQVFERERPMTT